MKIIRNSKKSWSTQLGHKPHTTHYNCFLGIGAYLLKSIHNILNQLTPHALMLHYSSVKYDIIKTIILNDADNIEENSTLEHTSPSINDVCTILS